MIRRLRNHIAALRPDARGATAVEYGMILAMIVLAAFASFGSLGNGIDGLWGGFANQAIEAM